MKDCNNGKFDGPSKTCIATCYPGYSSSGTAEYTCSNLGNPSTEAGQWTDGSLICTPITCEKAYPSGEDKNPVRNALFCKRANYSRLAQEFGQYPTPCTTVAVLDDPDQEDGPCLPGYNQNCLDPSDPSGPAGCKQKASTAYTCDRNGDWTQTETLGRDKVPLVCSAKPCIGYPATMHAADKPVSTSHDPHSLCSDEGAHPTGRAESNGRFGGKTCQAHCSFGYENVTSTKKTNMYTCLNTPGNRTAFWGVQNDDDGKLVCSGVVCVTKEPGCIAPNCSSAPNTQKCSQGSYADSGDPLHAYSGTECNAECKPGYEHKGGTKTYECDDKGQWVISGGHWVGSSNGGRGGEGGGGGGHWTDGKGSAADGKDLHCQGQSCGVAPHGFDESVLRGDKLDPKDEKDGQVWPYVVFEACTANREQDALFYSDAPCTGECTCTGHCDAGYSEDGTAQGITDRKFNCRQSQNRPFIWSPSDPGATVGRPAGPLVCKAVRCRPCFSLTIRCLSTAFLLPLHGFTLPFHCLSHCLFTAL